MKEVRRYYEEFMCTGIDSKYQIVHMLNSKYIMVQLVNAENGFTIHDSEYDFERVDDNTAIIHFIKTPIARKRYILLLIALI